MKKIKRNSEKTKKKKSKKEKRKIDFSDIEEKIKQLEAEKEIEEQTESEDNFFEPIRTIPISAEISAPVLERIIQRETPIDSSVEIESPREEERRIDYSAQNQPNYGFQRATGENEEKKYESTFVPPVLSRRGELDAIRPKFLKPPTETWTPTRENNEFIESEFIEEERKLPFEEQKKYKRFKLR